MSVRRCVLNAVRRIGVQNVLKALEYNDDPERRSELRKLFKASPSRTSQLKALLLQTRTELTEEVAEAINIIMSETGERLISHNHKLVKLGQRAVVLNFIEGKRWKRQSKEYSDGLGEIIRESKSSK